MSLAALASSPLDLYEAVVLADSAIDLAAMAEPAHDPPQEFDLRMGGRATWSRLLEYAASRDVANLWFKPGEQPCRFRLGRLTLSQAKTVVDEPGESSRAVLAVRYALRSVDGYEIGGGEHLRIERERGPLGEWVTWACMERLDLAHIVDLAGTVMVRNGIAPPFRPTLQPRSEIGPAPTSAASSTPSAA